LKIKPGDAVGQLLILPIYTPEVLEVNPDQVHQENSSRGNSGGIVDQHITWNYQKDCDISNHNPKLSIQL